MSTEGTPGRAAPTLQNAQTAQAAFTMLGSADASACEGDSCLVPLPVGTRAADVLDELEPSADKAAAASTRAVTAALDEGASL